MGKQTGNTVWKGTIKKLPTLLERLLGQTPYDIRTLSPAKMKTLLGNKGETPGVYLFSYFPEDIPRYVGRSKNLVRRLCSDHRSLEHNKAPLTFALLADKRVKLVERTPRAAREYLYEHYKVRFIPVDDPNVRAIFEIYVALELGTIPEFNSFEEH